MERDGFNGRGRAYSDFRPGYPDGLFEYMARQGLLTPDGTAADIGAGTGIFSRLLARYIPTVYAIEPSEDMRARGEACGGVRMLPGSAEDTGLPDASVDLVTAAQAFHWFDREAFRRECRRILRPQGHAALIWNQRDPASPVIRESFEINRRLCPDFRGFSAGLDLDAPGVFSDLFGGPYQSAAFENPVLCTKEGFVGRALSSSFAPRRGDGAYEEYVAAFASLFDKYAENGRLLYPYITRLFYGRV